MIGINRRMPKNCAECEFRSCSVLLGKAMFTCFAECPRKIIAEATLEERLQFKPDWCPLIDLSMLQPWQMAAWLDDIAHKCGYEEGKQDAEQDRWILVTKKLPEDYSDVLVWFEYFRYGNYNRLYQTYGIGNYSAQYDAWTVNHETGWNKLRVIAWRPLPASYQEDKA